jgi:hypothetical protein
VKFPPIPEVPRWATYIENRNPKFKIHKTKGHAVLALGCNPYDGRKTRAGVLYEVVEGEWVERERTTGEPRREHRLFAEAERKKCQRRHSWTKHRLLNTALITEDMLDSKCYDCGMPAWEQAGYKTRPTLRPAELVE